MDKLVHHGHHSVNGEAQPELAGHEAQDIWTPQRVHNSIMEHSNALNLNFK